jgi:hypothetical protein
MAAPSPIHPARRTTGDGTDLFACEPDARPGTRRTTQTSTRASENMLRVHVLRSMFSVQAFRTDSGFCIDGFCRIDAIDLVVLFWLIHVNEC